MTPMLAITLRLAIASVGLVRVVHLAVEPDSQAAARPSPRGWGRAPLPHDPPTPPGYVDPLAESGLLADLKPADDGQATAHEADPAGPQA